MESPRFPDERRAPVRVPAGPRILLTRDREDCAAWAAELEGMGAVPVAYPCIECRDIDAPALRTRLEDELPRAAWLAFTSRRGVAAFATLRDFRRPLPVPERVKVAVVGPATAQSAAAVLGRVDLAGGEEGTAASLAQALLPRLGRDDRVLIAVAENAGRTLEEAIGPAGTHVHPSRRLPHGAEPCAGAQGCILLPGGG